ncbi:MAG: phosphoesterase [Christensenellales bacterium]
MKAYYDLHIHSCLSPCAQDDMTPNNIAAMARLKGLSLIALTDHNCGRNLPAMAACAGEGFVPGIEVTSREEVHVLAYFSNVDSAVSFGELIYDSLPDISNRPEIFGRQTVTGTDDKPRGEVEKLLLSASAFSIEKIKNMVWSQGGCAVPAHINRGSFSVFSNLGFLPAGLFKCVEISSGIPCPPVDSGLFILNSSDAHSLADIAEPENTLENIKSATDFISFLRSL